MWDPTAALSNNEQQARQTRAKRFEAHLQASKQSNVGSNVRCLSALYCIASNKLVVEPTAFCRQDSASIYSISSGWCDCCVWLFVEARWLDATCDDAATQPK
jgi:hypothetical protein